MRNFPANVKKKTRSRVVPCRYIVYSLRFDEVESTLGPRATLSRFTIKRRAKYYVPNWFNCLIVRASIILKSLGN